MDAGLKKPGVGKEERSSKMESSCVSVEEIVQKEDQLIESTKAEMGEVREENERLKTLVARIAKDYQSLQMLFFDIVQQEQAKKPSETPSPGAPPQDIAEEPDQHVSLSLGTFPSLPKKEEKTNTSTSSSKVEDGLTLGLDCRFEAIDACTSPSNNSVEEEEEPREPWPPSKILKSMRPSGGDAKEAEQQAHAKKTRVSVRARCDTPTMHDGCQWRKYGQKIAKGNPCPRAYYRCTVAPCCPVKKQVQRCAEDMSILTTTYEGTHNHPLPISATAMASTTSAAACMLISGSTASRSPASSSLPTARSSISSSLNFNISDPNSRSRPFYLPNPTISSTPSYPTITLDLTSPPQTISQASQFSTRFSTSNFNTSGPRSSSFNFSSSDSNPGLAPTSWANGSSCLSYAAHNQPYTKSPISYLQSYLQKVANPSATGTQHTLTDSIAKAITSDPSLQSALATAITSYVGGPNGGQGGEEGVSHGLKHSSLAPYTAPAGVNGCRSSFLARTGSGSGTNAPQGSLMLLQNPLGLSSSKSASASPLDNGENIN